MKLVARVPTFALTLLRKNRHHCIDVGIHQIKGATQKVGVGIHNGVDHVTETRHSDLPKNLS